MIRVYNLRSEQMMQSAEHKADVQDAGGHAVASNDPIDAVRIYTKSLYCIVLSMSFSI